MKNFYLISITCALLFACCACVSTKNSTPQQTSELLEPGSVTAEENPKEIIYSDGTYSDGTFKIIEEKTGENALHFEVLNDNADIEDLGSFSVAFYRQYFSRKLRSGEALSETDLQLLDFCADTQLEALSFYTVVLFSDMIEYVPQPQQKNEIAPKKAPSNMTFKQEVQTACQKLEENFYYSHSQLRQKIRDFGKDFQKIPRDYINQDYDNICKIGREQIKSDFGQFAKNYSPIVSLAHPLSFIIFYTCFLWDWDGYDATTPSLRAYQNYNTQAYTSHIKWSSLYQDNLTVKLNDLKKIYDETGYYTKLTESPRSRRGVDDFRLKYAQKLYTTLDNMNYVYNDLPFSVFMKKAYADVQACKGFWNDNEEDMMRVAHELNMRMSDTKMLSKLSSQYSVNLYTQFLQLLKNELSEKEYKTLQTELKLYKVGQLADTPLEKNTLTPAE